MARSGVALQTGSPATDTGVLGHALAGAAGANHLRPFIPGVAQGGGVVGDEAGAAALTEMDGFSAALTGGRSGLAHIVVSQRRGDVLDMALSADFALPQGVARAGAGGGDRGSGELMLPLGDGGLLGIPAPLADVQGLAGGLAGGLPDDRTLVGVAQGRLVVPLFNHAALDAQVAVIAQGQAGGVCAVQQYPVVIFPAALVLTAAAVTVRVLAPAVGIAAAAGTGAVIGGGLISQVDEGHAVLHHVGVMVGVGDLVVHGIVPGLGVIGG